MWIGWDRGRRWSAAGASDEGGHDVGGVAIERFSSSVVAHRRSRVRVRRRLPHVTQRNPCVERRGDEVCRSECGLIRLSIPAAFVNRRTIRAGACRSSRLVPSWFMKIGTDSRSPM